MMTKLKFGLKQRMIFDKFEIQIAQMTPRKFDITIIEDNGYSNDDAFYFKVDSKNTLKDARDVQSEVYDYMMHSEFRDVKKSYYK